LLVGILFGLGGVAFAQGKPIDKILGDYEVIKTTNPNKHLQARIIVMRTSDGPGAGALKTYGLAFVSNRETGPVPKGDGMVCDEAVLIHDDTGITCTKVQRNESGHITFEETLTVGIASSPYCEALKSTLEKKQPGDGAKIVARDANECQNKQCVCYDIHHRPSPQGPPTQGSGTGRN
jgi:hypothetical protein